MDEVLKTFIKIHDIKYVQTKDVNTLSISHEFHCENKETKAVFTFPDPITRSKVLKYLIPFYNVNLS